MSKKIALITGANKGIGYQIAHKLGKSGHIILAAARNEVLGKKAVEQLNEEGIESYFIQLDVTDEQSIAAAAEQVEKTFGKIDVLVNNAGIFVDLAKSPSELCIKDFRKTMEVNVFGVFLVTQAFLKLLKKSTAGRIINMSSDLGALNQASDPNSLYDAVSGPGYRVSKAALNMLTLAFAKELRSSHITVNAVSPGWCKTDLGSDAAPNTAEQGADTPAWLATQDVEKHHGKFFYKRDCIAW